MTLTTSAALCTVKVSNDVLQKDLVLQLVLKLVEQKTHQVAVQTVTAKGSNNNVLSMSLAGSATALHQRNAILRSLVGAALHGAMDHHSKGSLAGGLFSVSASPHSTSVAAAANAARQQQWMSVADSVRNQGEDVSAFVEELNQILTASAFLLPYSAVPSLADLDLGVALLSSSSVDAASFPASVQRWLTQIAATLQDLAQETGVPLETYKLALPKQPEPAAPIFFYGTENADEVLGALYKNSSKKAQAQQSKNKEAAASAGGRAVPGGGKMTKQQKKQAAKQEKAKNNPAGGQPKKQQQQQEPATYDVTALDIRVGKILKVWPHEEAEKLFCEEIDLGNGEVRQIASGLRPFYQQQDLQDRMVLVLCNLKKRNLVGFPSHGMVLCASNADHTAVELVQVPQGTAVGERVVFDGLPADAEPEPENKVGKKKIFEQVAPDLKTDANGAVLWKTHAATTSAGAVTALNKMPNASVS